MDAASISNHLPIQFECPIAVSGDTNNIQGMDSIVDNVSQVKGFPSKFSTPRADGGKSVSRKDMNALFKMVSSLNYYFQYMGRNPWVSGTKYPLGAIVWVYNASDGGGEYICITDNKSGSTNPANDTTNWKKIGTATGLIVDTSSIQSSVESIIDNKLTADYLDTKLRYKLVVTGGTPGSYEENTIYFITE